MVSKELLAIIAMDISATSPLKSDTGHDDLGDEKLSLIHLLVSNYALKEYSFFHTFRARRWSTDDKES